MSESLDAIREALANQLTQFCWAERAHAYAPGKLTVPCVIPGEHTGEVDTSAGGNDIVFTLWGMVAENDPDFQRNLDQFVEGEGSIFDAIQIDPTLGLEVSAQATRWYGQGLIAWGGANYWAVKVDVSILR